MGASISKKSRLDRVFVAAVTVIFGGSILAGIKGLEASNNREELPDMFLVRGAEICSLKIFCSVG